MPFTPEIAAPLLTLGAALFWALSVQVQNLGLDHASAPVGTFINVSVAALLYWLIAPFYIQAAYWLTTATLLFVMVGLFRPGLSDGLGVVGIKYLGPTLSSGLSATSPIFAAAFAIVLLGETLTPSIAIGTIAVIAGVMVATLRPEGIARNWPIWAIALPIGAAFFRAAGHPFTKIGFGEVPSPVYAAMISNTVSAFVTYAVLRAQKTHLPMPVRGHGWFILAGLFNGAAVFLLYSALNIGQLLTIAPMLAITPVFTMLLGLLVFKRETFTWRMLATITLVIAGVVLVVVQP